MGHSLISVLDYRIKECIETQPRFVRINTLVTENVTMYDEPVIVDLSAAVVHYSTPFKVLSFIPVFKAIMVQTSHDCLLNLCRFVFVC